MGVSRKWLLVGACALVCTGSVIGLVLALSGPAKAAPVKPELSIDVVVVPEVMTAVYKDYSGQTGNFLAKTIIKNNGSQPVTNFHISYSVPGYLETAGQEDYPVILPGETVNDYCYPTFDAVKMKSIGSKTQAELDVNYTYDGSGGAKGTSKQFAFLGHNEWVRTYLPEAELLTFADGCDNGQMLAAWVTKDDPDVNRIAKRITGGISTDTDKGTEEAVIAVWNALAKAGFQYVSEPSSYWTLQAQTVQFPIETIDNLGGNCVDLSVLFSALLEAVSVKTTLCLSTGHCQIMFQLPESGTKYVIEETMIGDGVTLGDVVVSGKQWYVAQNKQNTWVEIDVEQAWANGMVPSW
jgi:transglutaminase-like putative cysteine protease